MGSNWRVTGEDQEFRCSVLGKRVTARGHVHVSYRREAKCVTCAAKFDLLCLSPQGYSTSNDAISRAAARPFHRVRQEERHQVLAKKRRGHHRPALTKMLNVNASKIQIHIIACRN